MGSDSSQGDGQQQTDANTNSSLVRARLVSADEEIHRLEKALIEKDMNRLKQLSKKQF